MKTIHWITFVSLSVLIVLPQCENVTDDPFYFDSTKGFIQIAGKINLPADSSILIGLRYGGAIGQELDYYGVCWRAGTQTITLNSPGMESARKPVASIGTDVDNDGLADLSGIYFVNYERFADISIYYITDTIYIIRPYLILNSTLVVYGAEVTVDTR